ncbi:MAG: YceI family protein [Bacteroidota bacterium]
MYRTLFICITLFFGSIAANAQNYSLAEGSSCSVSGTSNISDWTAVVNELDLKVVIADNFFSRKGVKVDGRVTSAALTIPVKSIDGGKGETMNDNIFEAFDESSNPQIIFQLQNGRILSGNAQSFELEISGILSMAGQQQEVTLSLNGSMGDNRSLLLKGKHKLKMTTFGMEPPTAMFGAIEAGDEVVIDFNLNLKKD